MSKKLNYGGFSSKFLIMKQEIFNNLYKGLKLDSPETDLNVEIISEWRNYSLRLFCEDSEEMQVESFNNEVELELTDQQYDLCDEYFKEVLSEVKTNYQREQSDGFSDDGDNYESTGHKQSDFY